MLSGPVIQVVGQGHWSYAVLVGCSYHIWIRRDHTQACGYAELSAYREFHLIQDKAHLYSFLRFPCSLLASVYSKQSQ